MTVCMWIDPHCKILWAVTDQTNHIGQTGNFHKKKVDCSPELHQPVIMQKTLNVNSRYNDTAQS